MTARKFSYAMAAMVLGFPAAVHASTFTGTISDSKGRPVANAVVEVLSTQGMRLNLNPVASVISPEQGQAKFSVTVDDEKLASIGGNIVSLRFSAPHHEAITVGNLLATSSQTINVVLMRHGGEGAATEFRTGVVPADGAVTMAGAYPGYGYGYPYSNYSYPAAAYPSYAYAAYYPATAYYYPGYAPYGGSYWGGYYGWYPPGGWAGYGYPYYGGYYGVGYPFYAGYYGYGYGYPYSAGYYGYGYYPGAF